MEKKQKHEENRRKIVKQHQNQIGTVGVNVGVGLQYLKMNINWDQELKQYLIPDYLKSWHKLSPTEYTFEFLQGNTVTFTCSIQGYQCKCHNNIYESSQSFMRKHSDEYVRVFNLKLMERLTALAQQREEQGGDNQDEQK